MAKKIVYREPDYRDINKEVYVSDIATPEAEIVYKATRVFLGVLPPDLASKGKWLCRSKAADGTQTLPWRYAWAAEEVEISDPPKFRTGDWVTITKQPEGTKSDYSPIPWQPFMDDYCREPQRISDFDDRDGTYRICGYWFAPDWLKPWEPKVGDWVKITKPTKHLNSWNIIYMGKFDGKVVKLVEPKPGRMSSDGICIDDPEGPDALKGQPYYGQWAILKEWCSPAKEPKPKYRAVIQEDLGKTVFVSNSKDQPPGSPGARDFDYDQRTYVGYLDSVGGNDPLPQARYICAKYRSHRAMLASWKYAWIKED